MMRRLFKGLDHAGLVLRKWVLKLCCGGNGEFVTSEQSFDDCLKLKYAELKRYGGSLSVLSVKLGGAKEFRQTFGARAWCNMQEQVMRYINANTRSVDVSCLRDCGTFQMLLSQTSCPEVARMISRLLDLMSHKTFLCKNQPVQFALYMGVALSSEYLRSVEEMIDAANCAAGKAEDQANSTAYYNDGHELIAHENIHEWHQKV